MRGCKFCANGQADFRPVDSLLHCLNTAKPDLVLVDFERVGVLVPHQAAMKEKGIGPVSRPSYCRLAGLTGRCSPGILKRKWRRNIDLLVL